MKRAYGFGLLLGSVVVLSGCGDGGDNARFDMADRLIELHEQAQDDDKDVDFEGQLPVGMRSSIPARYIDMRREGGVLVLTPTKALLKDRPSTDKDAATYLAADNIVYIHKEMKKSPKAYTVQFGDD